MIIVFALMFIFAIPLYFIIEHKENKEEEIEGVADSYGKYASGTYCRKSYFGVCCGEKLYTTFCEECGKRNNKTFFEWTVPCFE